MDGQRKHPEEILKRCGQLHGDVLQVLREADESVREGEPDSQGDLSPHEVMARLRERGYQIDTVAGVKDCLNDFEQLGMIEWLDGGRIGLIRLTPELDVPTPPGCPF